MFEITQDPVRKTRQEDFLMSSLVRSKLISYEILYEIRSTYNQNPYHNFLHALKVGETTLHLPLEKFGILEIKSLLFAGLLHDAGHTGQWTLLDEYNSVSIAFDILERCEGKYDLGLIDYTIVRKAIMGTVFKNRSKIDDIYGKVLADIDIGVIGEDIMTFTYYSLLLSLEMKVDIHEWIQKSQISYFKFLASLDRNILICEPVRTILPHSHRVIKDFLLLPFNVKKKMYNTVFFNNITLEEYRAQFTPFLYHKNNKIHVHSKIEKSKIHL